MPSGFRAGSLAAVAILALAQTVFADDLPIWRHGSVPLKSDAGIVMMASEGGFAAKQGLKIEMVQIASDSVALKALLSGDLDSYEGSPGAVILAGAHGADIKIVGCGWPVLTYGVLAKAGIKSVADLKGKTIGISSPGALTDILVRAVLEKSGVSATNIRFVSLGSDNDRFRAMANGVIDATAMSTEMEPIAHREGLDFFLYSREAVPEFLRNCIQMSGKTVAQRGELAARFLAAEMAGLGYAITHRDEEIALTRQLTQAKPDDPRPAYVFDELVRYQAIAPEFPLPVDRLEWMQALLLRTGNLDKPIALATITDSSIRERAKALLDR